MPYNIYAGNHWYGLAVDAKPSAVTYAGHTLTETDTGKSYTAFGGAWVDMSYHSAQAGGMSDAMHGVRTLANAHAHSALSGIGAGDHHPQTHGNADHTGDIIPAANQDFGAFYSDLAQIVTPANPAAGTRRLFVDSADGKLKVRTSGGASTSLEEAGGGGSFTLTTVEVSLGTSPRRAGRFTIAGAGLTVGKPVLVVQANGPYTGKGTRSDEAEMDALVCSGKVLNSTTVEVFYKSPSFVKGNFKFDYVVSA